MKQFVEKMKVELKELNGRIKRAEQAEAEWLLELMSLILIMKLQIKLSAPNF